MKALNVGICVLIVFSSATVLPASQPLTPILYLASLAFWLRSISTLGRPHRR